MFSARARNYPSALEASLFRDDVPVAVYDGLIPRFGNSTALPLLRVRRHVLGLDELIVTHLCPAGAWIDSPSPSTRRSNRFWPLSSHSARIHDGVEQGLRGRWCDRYETRGKRSGAFSSGTYDAPPYILMNYKDDVFSDVYTLAHEAGHSMHTWFSQKSQRFQDYDYPIFLAEVASTFNEELLTHHLLEETSDPKMRAYIINRQIDDLRGTLFRQTMFAEFEKVIHAIEESGDALTLDVFKSEYRKLLETYFAENFVLDPQLDLNP